MRILPKIQAFLWVASALAVAYSAWVFTGRILEHKKLEQRAARKAASSTAELDRIYGGDALRIVQFYARDGEVARGQRTLLCYGVLHATAVRIEPAVEGVRPSLAHCVEIAPVKTTNYTLTAEGEAGAALSRSVTVRVNRQ